MGGFTIAATAVAGHRMLLAGLLTLPTALRESFRTGENAWRRLPLLPLATAAAALAIHFGTFTAALFEAPVARVVLLVGTQPLFVLLFEWLVLGRRPDGRVLGLGALVLLGLWIMLRHDLHGFSLGRGEWTALQSGMALAAYLLLSRRLRAEVSVAASTAPLYGLTGLALLTFTAIRGQELWPDSGKALLLLVALAVVPTIGGHSAFQWALPHVGATKVSLAFLGEIPGAALLAWWFLGETPNTATLVGGALCTLGLAGLVLHEPAPAAPAPPSVE